MRTDALLRTGLLTAGVALSWLAVVPGRMSSRRRWILSNISAAAC